MDIGLSGSDLSNLRAKTWMPGTGRADGGLIRGPMRVPCRGHGRSQVRVTACDGDAMSISRICTRSAPFQRSIDSVPAACTAWPRLFEQRLAERLAERAEGDGVDGRAVARAQPHADVGLPDLIGIGHVCSGKATTGSGLPAPNGPARASVSINRRSRRRRSPRRRSAAPDRRRAAVTATASSLSR